MPTATLGAEEPEEFAVAPLGDAWTVTTGARRIVPPQTWTWQMATLAVVGLSHGICPTSLYRWVDC